MNSDHSPIPGNEDAIMNYVKEKETLKEEIKEKDKEIVKQKSRVYDLTQQVEELRKEIKSLKESASARQLPKNSGTEEVPSNRLGVVRPTTGHKRPSKSAKAKPSKSNAKASAAKAATEINQSETKKDEVQEDAVHILEHYKEVAKRYPDLKLSVILDAESVFKENDINNDGTIDEEELEKMLTKQGHLYTNKELRDIMAQIDVDNDKSIDIMEYLAVMEKVQQRKRVNLPQTLTRSAACAIQ